MRDRPSLAGINVGEVRPAVLAILRLVINHEIIAEGRSVILVHPNCKLGFKGSKLPIFEGSVGGEQKTFACVVDLVHPLGGRRPRECRISYHNVAILSLGDGDRVWDSVAFAMECFCFEIVLTGSVEQLNIVDGFLHDFLKISEIRIEYAFHHFPFVHIVILNHPNLVVCNWVFFEFFQLPFERVIRGQFLNNFSMQFMYDIFLHPHGQLVLGTQLVVRAIFLLVGLVDLDSGESVLFFGLYCAIDVLHFGVYIEILEFLSK